MRCWTIKSALTASMLMMAILARDCSTSKPFHLSHAQNLSGTFRDPSGAVLGGMKVRLLQGKRTVKRVRTDNLGAYDFGEIPSGTYTLRVQYAPNDAFCAPEIRCEAGQCAIDSILKPNPKNMVLVE